MRHGLTIGVSLALACALLPLAGGTAPARAAAVLNVPNAYPTIQAAVNAAAPGDMVVVEPGTYLEKLNFFGKDISVVSTSGPDLTTIDAQNSGTTVQMGPNGRLQGFRIINGRASFGGGIRVNGPGSVIRANVFEANTATAGGFGAGIAGFSASPLVDGNIFEGNFCDSQFIAGVAVFINSSSPVISNNLFKNNACRAVNMVLPATQTPLVINNTIVGNPVGVRVHGGVSSTSQVYRNNIITGNDIGLLVDFGGIPTWDHNLVHGNSSNYSGLPDQTGLNGNISADPVFLDVAAEDFHLTAGSPAIDAGSNSAAPAEDLDGNPRPIDGTGNGVPITDIGAYEFDVRIGIDIKPGSAANTINLKSNGNIPVGIISSPDFDAPNEVDQSSLTFGRTGDEQSLNSCGNSGTDINGDGLPDLVCHFGNMASAFEASDVTGILKGQTIEGTPIRGSDFVTVLLRAACTNPPPGLVGWWPGDGNGMDIAGENDGKVRGNASFGPGHVLDSFSLNGGSVELSSQPSLADGFTVDAWVRFDGANFDDFQAVFNNNQVFLRKNGVGEGNGFAVFVKLVDGSVEGRAQSTTVPVPGEWTHVAATWDGTTLGIYVNGELEGTSTRTGSLTTTTVTAQIGRGEQENLFTNPMRGSIDEFELYDRPLPASKISAIFEADTAGKCKPDGDKDGVPDSMDVCPQTPLGEPVNRLGCPAEACLPLTVEDGGADLTSLANWWPGDESAEDIVGANNGALTGNAAFGAGQVDEGFALSGGAVTLAGQPPITGGFTIDAWVRFDSTNFDDFQEIFNNNQLFLRKNNLSEGNGFAIFVKLDDGSVEGRAQSTTVPVPGQWTHVAGTWDGATLSIYVNGVLEGTSHRPGSLTSTVVTAQIGRGEQTELFGNQLFGSVDELEIFAEALPASSIDAIYRAGTSGKCKP